MSTSPDQPASRRRIERRPGQAARAARHAALAAILALALTACGGTPQQPEPPDPPAVDGGLFLSVAGDPVGLYSVDMATGAATRVGQGRTGTASTSSPGLSRGAGLDELFGSDGHNLRRIQLDGSGWTLVGDVEAYTEGLAYDPVSDVLYASSNGYLHVRSPSTGETLETLLNPPNAYDIEGLTFDFVTRTLYGLSRGHPDQPEFNQGLYALNIEAPAPAWTEVGSTGGLWEDAGLAFDVPNRVLYAVGRQGDLGALYRIDPDTGATTRVGATGLASATGGLAWLGTDR